MIQTHVQLQRVAGAAIHRTSPATARRERQSCTWVARAPQMSERLFGSALAQTRNRVHPSTYVRFVSNTTTAINHRPSTTTTPVELNWKTDDETAVRVMISRPHGGQRSAAREKLYWWPGKGCPGGTHRTCLLDGFRMRWPESCQL